MHSFGAALTWQFWGRHRLSMSASAGYLLLAAAVCPWLPEGLRQPPPGGGLPIAASFALAPVAFIFVHLLAVFTFGLEADIANKESGFPARMFVLPVTTRTLVAWPVAYGSCCMAGVWVFTAGLVLRPMGVSAPLWWPAATAAAFVTGLQMVSWFPFALAWLRVAATVALLLALFILPAAAHAAKVPEWLITAAHLFVVIGQYRLTVAGVARARRGQRGEWRGWERAIEHFGAWRWSARRPFASAFRAQLWLECRRHSRMLLLFLSLLLFALFPALFFVPRNDKLTAWKMLSLVLMLPPFVAGIYGSNLGKHDPFAKEYSLSPFFGTRPMTCAALVAVKWMAATLGAIVAWVVMLVAMGLWAWLGGRFDDLLAPFRGVPGAKLAAMALLTLLGLVFLTWRQLARDMWVGLTGRAWVLNTNGVVFGGLMLLALAAGLWLFFHLDQVQFVSWLAPWLVGVLVAAKLALSVWAARGLLRRRLLTVCGLSQWLAVWCTVVLVLSALAVELTPAEVASPAMLVGSVVLFAPLARLAVAPLALDWNRHR